VRKIIQRRLTASFGGGWPDVRRSILYLTVGGADPKGLASEALR